MNLQLTDLTLVVDRSGSMQSIREDAEGGINSLIRRQQTEPGNVLLTLVQFDTEYEFVHRGVPVAQVPDYQLVPRGMTALLDAIGRAINETGARLGAMAEADRPGLVVFIISTDGLENSSREFTKEQVKSMIEHQQSKYQWKFVFLGANAEAFAEAGSLGVAAGGAAEHAPGQYMAAYSATGSMVGRMKQSRCRGAEAQAEYTEQERKQMK